MSDTTVSPYDYAGLVKVETIITMGTLGDVLVTAYEGGYQWVRGFVKKEGWSGSIYDAWLQQGRIAMKMEDPNDEDSTAIYVLEPVDLIDGIQQFIDHNAKHGNNIIPNEHWDYDLNDADCILQFACYGELIFG